MYGCVSAKTSGFTRSAKRARIFSFRARSASSASSASLSTLNCEDSGLQPRSISAAVFPTPEKTTRPAASGAAAFTRSSSPPETMSNPAPCAASSFKIASEELAFTA